MVCPGHIERLGAIGNGGRLPWTGGDDAPVANHHDRVGNRIRASAVDQLRADDREPPGLTGRLTRWRRALPAGSEGRDGQKGKQSCWVSRCVAWCQACYQSIARQPAMHDSGINASFQTESPVGTVAVAYRLESPPRWGKPAVTYCRRSSVSLISWMVRSNHACTYSRLLR